MNNHRADLMARTIASLGRFHIPARRILLAGNPNRSERPSCFLQLTGEENSPFITPLPSPPWKPYLRKFDG